MSTPSSRTSPLRVLRVRVPLAAAGLLLGALLLSPFFANAQPAPPTPRVPVPTPGPTATPIAPATRRAPSPAPTAIARPPLPEKPTLTPTKTPTPTLQPSPTPRPTPTPTKTVDKPVVAVDVSIRPLLEMELVGEKVINANGVNQRLAQSQIEGARRKVSFAVRVQNIGTQTTTYKLRAPASGDGWKVAYFDAVEKGLDITSGITGKTGWSTPPIQATKMYEFRVDVVPDADKVGKAFRDLAISTSAVDAPKVLDTVVAGVGIQKVAGIEYTLDQGAHWKAAPLLEGKAGKSGKPINSSSVVSKAGIAVVEGRVVGLRAVPLVPTLPWPFEPDIKPLWHDAGYWNVGETIWVEAKTEREMISVECGNTLNTRLFVSPAPAKTSEPEEKPRPATVWSLEPVKKYDLDLRATQVFLRVGGGTDGQTTLVATVKDAKGNPLPGLRVRFRAYYSQDTPEGKPKPPKIAAGTLGGDGPEHDLATTDKEGVARISLTSSARESSVVFDAELLLEGEPDKEQLLFGAQMLQFFDEHPQPVVDDDF